MGVIKIEIPDSREISYKISKQNLEKFMAEFYKIIEKFELDDKNNNSSEDLRLQKMRLFVDSFEDDAGVQKSVLEAKILRENLMRNYD